MDGAIEEGRENYPIEIKGINQFDYPRLKTVRDFFNSPKAWINKIPGQIYIYELLENKEMGYLILKNKANGQINPIPVPLDYTYAETLLKKAEAIEKHVKEESLPDRIDNEKLCGTCAYYHICLPDQINIDKRIDSPELESMIEEWARLKFGIKPLEKKFKELDETIKGILKGIPEAIIGDWMITGKEAKRNGHVVNPYTFWEMKIKSMIKVTEIKEIEE
jgi:hypothetical protein